MMNGHSRSMHQQSRTIGPYRLDATNEIYMKEYEI